MKIKLLIITILCWCFGHLYANEYEAIRYNIIHGQWKKYDADYLIRLWKLQELTTDQARELKKLHDIEETKEKNKEFNEELEKITRKKYPLPDIIGATYNREQEIKEQEARRAEEVIPYY